MGEGRNMGKLVYGLFLFSLELMLTFQNKFNIRTAGRPLARGGRDSVILVPRLPFLSISKT